MDRGKNSWPLPRAVKIIFLMLLSMFGFMACFKANGETQLFDYSDYQQFLEKYVVEEKIIEGIKLNVVDYESIYENRNNPDSLYRKILRQLELFDLNTIETLEGKIAFWINAYNIGAVKIIIDHYPVDSIRSSKIDWLKNPWDDEILEIGKTKYSLGQIEHEILIGKYREPLIHYAIVCASVSCPDIIPQAYTGDRLQKQLEKQAKNFLQSLSKGLRVIKDRGVVYFSKIFSFDKKSFPKGAKDALAVITPFIEDADVREYLQKKDYRIKYLDYNWGLNSLKKTQ
jgi:hypothetical protein